MNRTKQLKLLDEEIRHLFSEGTTESEAYDQLRSDQRFDTVRRSTVQSLYNKLQKDVDKQAKNAEKQARAKELKEQKRYRQNADNLLLYDNQLTKKEFEIFEKVWEDRYFSALTRSDGRERTYKVTDLYQNVSKEVSLLVDVAGYVIFHPLNGQFGLAEIWHRMSRVFSIHLVYIDLIESKMELVQEVKRNEPRFVCIFVDSVDRSKFVLTFITGQRFSAIPCNLSRGQVNVGEEVLLLENYNYVSGNRSYFNNQLFGLAFDAGHYNDASIVIQDLDGEKGRKTLKLELLPNNVRYQMPPLRSPYQWFCDRVFMPIQFISTGFYGIAFTEPQTRKWLILEFATNLPITKLTVVENCSLLVRAGKRRQVYDYDEVSKVYKLPIRKPESLRYKAWLKTISWFKKQNVNDPYKEARRFLPFNSEIHTPFNVDEQENDDQE